mmetsp:Transcript_44185/g.132416  ORF Transcript_44185/g.132416 Transcript_44185/m.132416 type:complete len:207 (-) Transcript_44185:288-908(-)
MIGLMCRRRMSKPGNSVCSRSAPPNTIAMTTSCWFLIRFTSKSWKNGANSGSPSTFMYNTSTIFFMEISFPCLLCGFAACSAPSGTSSANRACDARVLGARFMALLPGSDVRSHDGRSPSLSNGVEPVMSTARVRAVIPTYWTRRLSWKAAKEEAGKLRDAAAVGPVSSRRASGCRATAPVTVTRQLGPTLCRGRPRRGPFPFGER